MDQNQGVLAGLTVERVLVVQLKHHPDHVYVTTSLPSPIPGLNNQPLTLQFIAAARKDVEWEEGRD